MWRSSDHKFQKRFTTKATWDQIRTTRLQREWYKGIWFKHATPKYSFFAWLAVLDMLSTGDRMKGWGSGQRSSCVFCDGIEETRDHHFFGCSYSSEIWNTLTRKLLGQQTHDKLGSAHSALTRNECRPSMNLLVQVCVSSNTIPHLEGKKPTSVTISHHQAY